MKGRLRVGVLFGGRSAEHEVSLWSAKNVLAAIDQTKFIIVPIGIARDGKWYTGRAADLILDPTDVRRARLATSHGQLVDLIESGQRGQLEILNTHKLLTKLDVVFPVLHGPYGEDGSIQGLCKLAGVPCVGPGVLGSAVAMDKYVAKRLLKEAGVPVGRFAAIRRGESYHPATLCQDFGLPLFVKPANLGSSVGVVKVERASQLRSAVTAAGRYDRTVLIEEFIDGREIELSVLGNDQPAVSVPGEIVVRDDDFYSYDAKYLDQASAELKIPAKLTTAQIKRAQSVAVAAYHALDGAGMARVDCFLRGEEVLVNEVNTIPGFTNIGMYPKLWEAGGLKQPELITRLIELAMARFAEEQALADAPT